MRSWRIATRSTFGDLKPNQRECASVQLCFTAREDLLKAYEEFIDFRAEKLAEQLNEFVGLGQDQTVPTYKTCD